MANKINYVKMWKFRDSFSTERTHYLLVYVHVAKNIFLTMTVLSLDHTQLKLIAMLISIGYSCTIDVETVEKYNYWHRSDTCTCICGTLIIYVM